MKWMLWCVLAGIMAETLGGQVMVFLLAFLCWKRRKARWGMALMVGALFIVLQSPLSAEQMHQMRSEGEITVVRVMRKGTKEDFVFHFRPDDRSSQTASLLSSQSVEKDLKQIGLERWSEAIGKRYHARLKIHALDAPSLPGTFHSRNYYGLRGISGTAEIQQAVFRSSGIPWELPILMAQRVLQRAARALGGEAGSLMERVLLGHTVDETTLLGQMKKMGLSHLLAASGLHVQLMFQWGLWMGARWGRSRDHAVVWIFIVLFFYAMILGFPASIVRALLFRLFGETARLRRRKVARWQRMGAALLVIFLLHPLAWFDIGMQLSFLCAMAIDIAQLRARRSPLYDPVFQSLRTSFWILALTWPVLVNAGLGVTPWTIFANLFAIPLFSLLFAMGLLTMLIRPWPFIGSLSAAAFRGAVEGFGFLIGGLQSILPEWELHRLSEGELAIYLFLIALLLCVLLGKQRWLTGEGIPFLIAARRVNAFYASGIRFLLWASILVAFPICLAPLEAPFFTVLNVGQGDAMLFGVGGRRYMFDVGGKADWRTGESVQSDALVAELQRQGIFFLDGIFLSHNDFDHSGDLEGLMHHIPVAFVMTSPLGNREQASVEKRGHASAAYRSVESQSVKNEWMEHRETGAGWNNGERSELRRVPKHLYAKQGAEMDLGAPVGGRSACLRVISAGQFDAEDKNNASLCLLLDFGAQVLLLGDQEEEGCLNLEGIRAPLELLKCAHHGSAHGTSQQLLNRLKPDHAVISVGADNRYGHPDAHTLLRLKQSGARIERTDEQGSLTYLRHPFSRGLVVQNEAQMRTWSALRWGLVILVLIFWEVRMQKLSPWKRLV